ncbi:penicillin acylase family protein [Streptomyces sp. NPDC056231]|uniref:penicillin acylase family protein n=1 Tax=Streptomyces sp. NPDC056231 TaxID=3345755 RepID=UPI003AACB15C
MGAAQGGYTKRYDRGFRLNLVRRTGSGRAAEVWGRTAVPWDTAYCHLGLAAAARAATEQLAGREEHRRHRLERIVLQSVPVNLFQAALASAFRFGWLC